MPMLRVGCLIAFGVASLAQGAETTKPNIVVIVADDQGYADLGIQGGKDIPTPNIDSIAKNGVRCTNGYVSGPYCSPTRAGLLTGRYQQRFGHEFNPGGASASGDLGLTLNEKTLANRLKSAGYATGMVGKWHLGSAPKFHPMQRGFDEFFGFLGGAHSYFEVGNARDAVQRGTEPVDKVSYLTDDFAREAVAFIDRHHQHPFFLYLTFNAVHTPMHAPPKYQERFASIENEKRRTYAAMTSAMDDAVGAVLGKLKEAKVHDNTLIFYISDNGGPPVNASNNGALRGFKAQTLEGGIRVPFFVQWKAKLPAGAVYEQPVIQLDILPTALAAAGTPAVSDTKLDGVNLLPYLMGENKETKAAPHEALYWRFGLQTAIRMGNWKLVQHRESKSHELYDLSKDIGETTDLAKQHPDKFAELEAAWKKWDSELVEPTWGQARANANTKKKNKKATN
ncbi:MAG: sulfatase [Planctomycetota bacterium]